MLWAVLCFVTSAVIVDLAGYWLHRLAHAPWSPLYRPHMRHHVHNYPPRRFLSDRYETSGSDSLVWWFAPFGVVYAAAVILLGLPHPVAILSGGALVALASSLLHDASHVRGSMAWRLPGLRRASEHHREHHSHMRRNYGILLSLWDRLFGTRYASRAGR